MAKIEVANPVVALGGDAMARIEPILPHLDSDRRCDDPGIGTRDALASVRLDRP